MPVYLIANIRIEDRQRYSQYEAGFLDVFDKYEGKLLAVDEGQRTVEGTWEHTRTVLIEFPNEEKARSWFDSPEYQELAKHRLAASKGDIALITGLP